MKRHLLLILLSIICMALPQRAGAVDRTTLYTAVLNKGIYAFDPSDLSGTPVRVMSDDDYGYLSGECISAYGDGVLYVYQWKTSSTTFDLTRVRFVKYRRAADGSWSCAPQDVIDLPKSYESFPHMFTYDPYSKKLYGFRRGANPTLYEINPETGAMTVLAAYCSLNYNSMVASSTGSLYVMGETASHDVEYIFSKDKTSITHSMIGGYTNLLSDDVLLSTFAGNNDDKNLYVMNRNEKIFSETEEGINNSRTDWNANGIYTVNMKNLTYNQPATKLGNVFRGEKVVGFFAITEEVAADQLPPAAVTDLTVSYPTPGLTAATISATAPMTLFDGRTPMNEGVTLKYYIGDRLIGQKSDVSAGVKTSISYDFVNEGAYVVRAVASNANGDGPEALCNTYAGYDTPSAVTDLRLTIDPYGHYTLTWGAPTEGVNGGMVNTSALTYTVERQPGGATVTTSDCRVEGEIGSALFSDYYFIVQAAYGDRLSPEATSNHVTYGEAIELPYVEDFSDEATWGRHTVWNVNGDATWDRGASMLDGISASYNGTTCVNEADDWLITPPMKMHAGTTYTIRFRAFNNQYLSSRPTPLKLYVSPTAHPETYPDQPENHMDFIGQPTLGNWLEPTSVEYTYDCVEEGIRHLAFHLTAYPNTRVWIEEYSIVPGASLHAPADVDRLTVTPDEEGALKTTISFTAPTTTMANGVLTSIDYISIYRDGDFNEIFRFLAPAPGAQLTFVDEAEDLTNDVHEYKVKCFNANGASEGLSRSVLVGQDYASAPTHLRVDDLGDVFRLSWEDPISSVYGGYVDFDHIKYWIMIGNAEGEGNPITLEDFYEGNTYDIQKSGLYKYGFRDDQMLLNFWVISVTPRGSHINGSVNYTSAIYGTPWDIPFNEGLAVDDFGPFTRTYPWSVVTYNPYAAAHKDPWYIVSDRQNLPVSVKDHDGTGGMFMWHQTVATVMESYFLTPQIEFAQAKKPTLTFWVWHNNGVPSPAENWIKIFSCRYANEYDEIPGFETISIADGQGNGWRRHEVDLSGVAYPIYRLAFMARAESGVCFFIDDLVVDDDTTAGLGTVLRPEYGDKAPIYDLSGRRMTQPAHGLYIEGGKKLVK